MERRYEKSFKLKILQMISQENQPILQVAREFGVPEKTLYHWRSTYKKDDNQRRIVEGKIKADHKVIRGLQHQIKELREKNESLLRVIYCLVNNRF
ncbi:transposase [Paenibacillus sp. OSY-SE]|uniref:transposase n=1 Tax=Paenibacillus sp. OSY-SE TaxID=1196323 RepID=UPI0003665A05|nr:transposase [Paenibacillus sp. OSY-SE]